MPRALRPSFDTEEQREGVQARQARQASEDVQQRSVDDVDEDESEGYNEEGDDDEDEEGAFPMKPTLTTQTAVNRPLDQLNGDISLTSHTRPLLTLFVCPQTSSKDRTWTLRLNISVMLYGQVSHTLLLPGSSRH